MTFDVYPNPPAAPLELDRSDESDLVRISERAAVDPVTGRNTMFITLVKLTGDCSASGPPGPIVRLKLDNGPLTEVRDDTPLLNTPAATEPAAIANLRATATADVYVVEVEVLQPGGTWDLQIEHDGPAPVHEFTWVVADRLQETRRPWISTSIVALDFGVTTGGRQTKSFTIANRGTGPLTLGDADGTDLGQGFTLDAISPHTVGPNECATAEITFTGAASAGTNSADYEITSDDPAASTEPGHNRTVRLTATTHLATAAPVVHRIDPEHGRAGDPFTIFGDDLVLRVGDDVSVVFFGPLEHHILSDEQEESVDAPVQQPTFPTGVTAQVPFINSHHDHEVYSVSLIRSDGAAVTVIEEFGVAIL